MKTDKQKMKNERKKLETQEKHTEEIETVCYYYDISIIDRTKTADQQLFLFTKAFQWKLKHLYCLSIQYIKK